MTTRKSRFGFVAVMLLSLSRQAWARPILNRLTRISRRQLKRLEGRKERALAAREQPGRAASELIVAVLMSILFAVLGCAFMLGVALTPSSEDKLFAAALSMSAFGLLTLSLSRIGHWEAVIADSYRIDRLELALRQGHIPANDD